MSSLAGLHTEDNTIQGEKDTVGGAYQPLESDIYPAKITLAYISKSKGGAMALNIHFDTIKDGSHKQQLWVTSGDAKGNKTFFETKNGDRKFLPGFIHANALCLLTVGKKINEVDTEEKVVKLYSYESQSEEPTKVEVLTDLIGQEVYLGLQKQIVDKNVKDANGSYVPSGETREVNELDKIFRAADKKTTTEAADTEATAAFFDTWLEKNKGNTQNRAKGAANGGAAGAPAGRAPLNSGGGKAASPFGGGGQQAQQAPAQGGGSGLFG